MYNLGYRINLSFHAKNKKKIPPFIDYSPDLLDALLLCSKNNMGYPNLLDWMSHYFHDKVIPNLLKLVNSPSLTKHKDIASLIKDE